MEYLVYLLIPVTMFFSYMHGRGDGPDLVKQWYESKGYYVAAMAVLGAALGYLNIGWWGLTGALVSPIYWFGFRSSRQAHAELSYMYRVKDYDLLNIAKQYLLPVGVCIVPILVSQQWVLAGLLPVLVGVTVFIAALTRLDENHARKDERKARAMVETLGNGVLGGTAAAGLLLALVKLVG
jgi:hypothetical protein